MNSVVILAGLRHQTWSPIRETNNEMTVTVDFSLLGGFMMLKITGKAWIISDSPDPVG